VTELRVTLRAADGLPPDDLLRRVREALRRHGLAVDVEPA
jgi:hypothetical protein